MSENGVFLSGNRDQMLRDAIRMTRAFHSADEDSRLSVELEMARLVRRAASQTLPDFEALASEAIRNGR